MTMPIRIVGYGLSEYMLMAEKKKKKSASLCPKTGIGRLPPRASKIHVSSSLVPHEASSMAVMAISAFEIGTVSSNN